MILSLDNLAHRYGRLPSEVLQSASTLDLYVMDAAISYREYQQRKADGRAPDLTTDELQDILRKTRNA